MFKCFERRPIFAHLYIDQSPCKILRGWHVQFLSIVHKGQIKKKKGQKAKSIKRTPMHTSMYIDQSPCKILRGCHLQFLSIVHKGQIKKCRSKSHIYKKYSNAHIYVLNNHQGEEK